MADTEETSPAVENASLTLGFLGGDEVHRSGAKALLDDLITAFRKSHRKAEVRFILAVDAWSDTLNFLGDYALTQGFKLGLVGYHEDFDHPEVKALFSEAEGAMVVELPENSKRGVGETMARILSNWDESRLILVSTRTKTTLRTMP